MTTEHSELGTVPNGSEPFGTVPNTSVAGRIPVKTDQELLDIARRLHDKQGKPPSIQQLVMASGGCQRQRAVRAVHALRVELSKGAVRSQLVMPASFQDELRELMGRWINLAAEQLSERHAEADLQAEMKLAAAADSISEQETRIRDLKGALSDVQHLQQELLLKTRSLEKELAATGRQRDQAVALAEERQRVMDSLLTTVTPLSREDISPSASAASGLQTDSPSRTESNRAGKRPGPQ